MTKELIFSSEENALQYLSDLTGKKVKVAKRDEKEIMSELYKQVGEIEEWDEFEPDQLSVKEHEIDAHVYEDVEAFDTPWPNKFTAVEDITVDPNYNTIFFNIPLLKDIYVIEDEEDFAIIKKNFDQFKSAIEGKKVKSIYLPTNLGMDASMGATIEEASIDDSGIHIKLKDLYINEDDPTIIHKLVDEYHRWK